MKTLAERTQEAIDAGFTVGALADAAGKSSSAVSQWLSGSTKSIKSDSAVGLQRLTGWSAEWWITGKGERGKTTAPSAPPQLTLGAVALRLAMATAKLDLRDRRAIADSLVYMLTEGGPSEKEASAIDLRSQQLVNLAGFVGDIDRSDIAPTPQDVLAAYQQLDADGRLAVLSAIRKATEEDGKWGQQNIGTLANKTGRRGPKDERPNSKSRSKPGSTGSGK